MAVSTLHLGKPLRAYKSINNLITSWLSREILMFGLFVWVGFISIFFNNIWTAYLASGLGFILLISIEMLYVSVRSGPKSLLSSGNTIAIALVFASLFGEHMSLLIALLAFKTMIYLIKVGSSLSNITPAIAMVSLVRLILGFVIPFGLIALRNESFSWVLLLSVILGEIIDRLIFYREFKPERPFESYLADVR
jgi:anaerobic dimethyl sulfoxide reductase subunit C (anchor subunit)